MKETTLCYIQDRASQKYLMLYRTKKKNDENAGKYVGLGGHFLPGETPLACIRREVREESGLELAENDLTYRGIVDFFSDVWEDERMHLFTANTFVHDLPECDEGQLRLVSAEELFSLKLWEGDLIFLSLLLDGAAFFSLQLFYEGESLKNAILNGKKAELFDLLDENGEKTGRFKERSLVHRDGDRHGTAHIWIYRKTSDGIELLLQKRSDNKDSYPGCWDISAAGHIEKGEEALFAALRELSEELGVQACAGDLVYIGSETYFRCGTLHNTPFLDNERVWLYLLDGARLKKSDLCLCREEVEDAAFFPAQYILEHCETDGFCTQKSEVTAVLNALKGESD